MNRKEPSATAAGHGRASRGIWAKGAAFPVLMSLCLTAAAAPAEGIERPYMLWSKAEIEKIREKIKSEPWARERLEAMRSAGEKPAARAILDNYFLHLVTGDKEAGEYERTVLKHLGILLESPDYEEGRSIDISAQKNPPIANYDMGFRYDLFMDVLSPKEKHKLEDRFNKWVFNQSGHGEAQYVPQGWESHLAAYNAMVSLASGDKRLVDLVFKVPSGPKAYLDGMVDGYFPRYGGRPDLAALGVLWFWCRGVERLGMSGMGFGCVGENGGTLRKLTEGYYIAGDPAIEIPGGTRFYGSSALTLTRRIRQGGFFDMRPSYLIPEPEPAGGGTGVVKMVASRLRHPRDIFRAPLVIGRMRDGAGEWPLTIPFKSDSFYGYDKSPRDLVGKPQIDYNPATQPRAFGMQLPLLFELAHLRWPDAGFDYFLARMAPLGSDTYYPSLYWGLDPIPRAKTKPPPVSSMILRDHGLALLRAEEGEKYWTSPAPYAVLRLAEGLGDEIKNSALSLHSFLAFNRPIYRHSPGRGDRRLVGSGMTHNTVVVDNAARTGAGKGSIRRVFDPAVKFVDVRSEPFMRDEWIPGDKPLTSNLVSRARGIRPDVEMERALSLTREYLLDVFRVVSGSEHTYHWVINALGSAEPDKPDAWKPTDSLDESISFVQKHRLSTTDERGFEYELKIGFSNQRRLDPGNDTWSLNLVQTASVDKPENTVMGAEWYGRKIGSRITMLAEEGTRAYLTRGLSGRRLTAEESKRIEAIRFPKRVKVRNRNYDKADTEVTELEILPPGGAKEHDSGKEASDKEFKVVGEPVAPRVPEYGGTVLLAERRAADTMFVALHEPFEKGESRINEFRRIQQTGDAVAVAIRGEGVNDRVMIRQGKDADAPVTLGDGNERFVFKGFAYVRIGPNKVTVAGDLREMDVSVKGRPMLTVNGKKAKAKVKNGKLVYRR